ncbi:MAG: CDF family Co(II)/Ni(II) efflux transporter DmeF [Desulfobacterales bacterium]
MKRIQPPARQHRHGFYQDQKRPGETRTIIVIAITGIMMVVETAAGMVFGSMALLADGLHMASHAAALSINVFAYIYARRYAFDERYTFGTGKVNALGGFTGAVLLAIFASIMAWESAKRFIYPVEIAFNHAIFVAVLGLIVNGASVFILNYKNIFQQHHRDDSHKHGRHHDHNLKSAYLHVLADALTSLLAIFALLTAKYFGFIWMDPFMGIVGAVLVSRWSLGLIRDTGDVLLDKRGPEEIRSNIKKSIEKSGSDQIADLHLWSIGPNIYAAIITISTRDPKSSEHYKQLIPSDLNLVHVTVEIEQYEGNMDS